MSFSTIGFARADERQQPIPYGQSRISDIEGSATIQQSGQSVSAELHAQLHAGDYVSTDPSSRIEVALTPSDIVRAGESTQVRFPQLDGNNDVVQLAAGTIVVRVLRVDDDHVTVETPSVDVVPDGAGTFVVSVDESGISHITARDGSATIKTQAASQALHTGSTMQVTGNASDPQYRLVDEAASTDFETWSASRDATILAYEKVGPAVADNGTLDNGGGWQSIGSGQDQQADPDTTQPQQQDPQQYPQQQYPQQQYPQQQYPPSDEQAPSYPPPSEPPPQYYPSPMYYPAPVQIYYQASPPVYQSAPQYYQSAQPAYANGSNAPHRGAWRGNAYMRARPMMYRYGGNFARRAFMGYMRMRRP